MSYSKKYVLQEIGKRSISDVINSLDEKTIDEYIKALGYDYSRETSEVKAYNLCTEVHKELDIIKVKDRYRVKFFFDNRIWEDMVYSSDGNSNDIEVQLVSGYDEKSNTYSKESEEVSKFKGTRYQGIISIEKV